MTSPSGAKPYWKTGRSTLYSYHYGNLGHVTYSGVKVTFSCSISSFNHRYTPQNAWVPIVVEAPFYSIPVGLHRLCPARYSRCSEWDGAIKGQHLVGEEETS